MQSQKLNELRGLIIAYVNEWAGKCWRERE